MTASSFVLVLVSCWAVTYIIVDSILLEPLRSRILWRKEPDDEVVRIQRSHWLSNLFACYFCVGFWGSLGLFVAYGPLDRWLPLRVLCGATCSYSIDLLLRRLEPHKEAEDDDSEIDV